MPSKPKSSARQKAHRGGQRAERWAAWYLRLQFYSILATRYKTPVGEVDLIAQRWGHVIFVEVKVRNSFENLTSAFEAVNTARISRAAEHYLSLHPELGRHSLRFDVIFLAPRHWPRHVRNAFQGSLGKVDVAQSRRSDGSHRHHQSAWRLNLRPDARSTGARSPTAPLHARNVSTT
ncbi:YraN family protein [Devosia algicola]|uniref:UPF0102 protein PSQ19_14045 n=1 Tax=Devosia algicola TaxID=3026418 RepID=A0ABY7YKP9_9HYPH|nr:YraN family protein [Devosia algicola]WDR01831.1 YraN family protein [Devosia algicola]